jgi:hypothetical protein
VITIPDREHRLHHEVDEGVVPAHELEETGERAVACARRRSRSRRPRAARGRRGSGHRARAETPAGARRAQQDRAGGRQRRDGEGRLPGDDVVEAEAIATVATAAAKARRPSTAPRRRPARTKATVPDKNSPKKANFPSW